VAPLVDANITPDQDLFKSYVYFRAGGTEDFYYVLMAGTGPALAATLPRPLPETKNIDYFLQATDRNTLTKKTPDYLPPVVQDNVCRVKGNVVGPAGAGLTIGLTREGQAPVPPGFNRKDIAFIILATGAVVTLAAALQAVGGAAAASATGAGGTAGSAGGISTGVIVGAGVLAAGVVAAVVATNSGGGSTSGPAPTVTATASPTSGGAPLAVAFSATVTGAQPVTVSWSFGDSGTGTGMTTTHVYRTTGTFTVTATATDAHNRTATSSPLTISVPGPEAVIASISWSGVGDVNLSVVDSAGAPVGQNVPAGCATVANRTEEVIMEGASLATGNYTVKASAVACPSGTNPSAITAVAGVVDSTGATRCAPQTVTLTLGAPDIVVCTFSIP
jgi:PKD repeat protein